MNLFKQAQIHREREKVRVPEETATLVETIPEDVQSRADGVSHTKPKVFNRFELV